MIEKCKEIVRLYFESKGMILNKDSIDICRYEDTYRYVYCIINVFFQDNITYKIIYNKEKKQFSFDIYEKKESYLVEENEK